MVIIKEKVDIDKLKTIENETFFGDMILSAPKTALKLGDKSPTMLIHPLK